MNTFWLKIAALVVLVLGVVVVVSRFSAPQTPKPEQKTVYDVWEEDDQRLRAEPETQQPPKPSLTMPKQQKIAEPAEPQFRKLSEIEEIEAQRIFEFALNQRKMGRLPGMGFKKMVDSCRQIIEKYPGTVYAFKAKRMLADIPERYKKMYKITDEEMGL